MRKAYHFKVVRMLLLLLVGAPVFVAASVFLLADRPHSPVVWIISGAGILFFGSALVVGVINAPRLIGNSEALILTPQGLTICHAGKRRQNFIAWKRIAGFSESRIQSNRFIAVHLHDPYLEIDRERNVFYRTMMNFNTRYAGTPYSISPNAIRCDSDELIATLVNYLEQYGQSAQDASDKNKRLLWINPNSNASCG